MVKVKKEKRRLGDEEVIEGEIVEVKSSLMRLDEGMVGGMVLGEGLSVKKVEVVEVVGNETKEKVKGEVAGQKQGREIGLFGRKGEEEGEIIDVEENGVLYLENDYEKVKRRWKGRKVVSPNDRGKIKELIYEHYGQLEGVLMGMNWGKSSRGELMKWVVRHGLVKDLMAARDSVVDLAEEKIVEHVGRGDLMATMFTLKTVGKYRGWNEKSSIEEERDNVYKRIVSDSVSRKDLIEMSNEELTQQLLKNLN